MANLTGQAIKSYRLIEMIGSGSFGEVYHAHQSVVEREVAIKIILPHYANHPDFIRRFESEAQLVARVEHPFIVPLYDYWREPNRAYLVMRWLRGGSLRDFIKNQHPTPLDSVARIFDQIAAALAIAHANGVVHRDLKPANILLDEQGNAYLTDFGIAKDLRRPEKTSSQEAVVGSPAYLSPEQVRAEDVTHLSDIYSLGILLFEVLTGQKPFRSDSLTQLLSQQMNDALPALAQYRPDLPDSLNNIIQRATAKNPKNRYPNTLVMAADLRRALHRADLLRGIQGNYPAAQTFDPISDSTQELSDSLEVELPAPENPYKGLRAFQESDSADFFGRGYLIRQILDRLQEEHRYQRFLAVVGPSGSGKSSVIKAGVLPTLRQGALPDSAQWFMVEMVPSAHPFEELEAALLRIALNPPSSLLQALRADESYLARILGEILPPRTELLLLIDQFEEVFTLVESEAEREKFLNTLLHAVTQPDGRLRLIITLRADFYDKPLYYKGFGEILRQRTEVVLPLSEEELEEAITAPALRVGLQLESGLVRAIVEDVQEQPGALPLLQYALLELYERREDKRLLTLHGYREINGVSGALARRAEKLYQNANPILQPVIRQLFIRLVSLGEGTEDTRRRVYQRELAALKMDKQDIQAALDLYGKYRLLTFDNDPISREPTLEVAHEALIRQWYRLRGWIDDLRDDLRQYTRLVSLAKEWRDSSNDASYLATGAQLSQLQEWSRNTEIILTEQETDYLQASSSKYQAELAREAERQAREETLEQRSRRFLVALLIVMGLALVGALLLTFLAMDAREEAESSAKLARQQQELAEASEDIAQSLALVANARNTLNEGDPNTALALAIAANASALPEAERMLAQTAYSTGIRYQMSGHDGSIAALDISPDGRLGVSASADWKIIIWDLETGQEKHRLVGHTQPVTSVVFSPDGSQILSGSVDMTLKLWSAETGELIRNFLGHSEQVNTVAFSPDGTLIASGSGNPRHYETLDRVIRIWDAQTGQELRQLVHLGAVLSAEFSPDGEFLLTTSGTGTAPPEGLDSDRRGRLWSVSDGRLIRRYEGFSGLPREADFSPDGTKLAFATWDNTYSGTIRVFDRFSGSELQRIFAHPNIITHIEFMPDGESIVSASWDNSLGIWDVEKGTRLARYTGHGDRILAMALSPNGEYILTGTGNIGDNFEVDRFQDNHLRLWDLRSRAELNRYEGHEDWLWTVAYHPAGKLIVSGSGDFLQPEGDNSIRIWDAESGEQLDLLNEHSDTVDHLAFNADGSLMASTSWDTSAIVWDFESRQVLHRLLSHSERVLSADFHPTLPTLLTSSRDQSMIEWNLQTGQEMRKWEGLEGQLYFAEFSPDGKWIATADADGRLILWDYATGEEAHRYEGHTNRIDRVTFSPDSRLLLSTSSRDNSARVWDVESGQQIHELIGHVGGVTDGIFDPLGQYIITGGADKTVRVWDVNTGEELRRYEGHTDWVVSVDISPNGMQIISGSDDNTLRRWHLARSVADLEAWARENRFIPILKCEALGELNRMNVICE